MKRLILMVVLLSLASGLYAQGYSYNQWRMEYTRAQASYSMGNALLIGGAVMGVVGSIAGLKGLDEGDQGTKFMVVGIVGAVAGISGFVIKSQARTRIRYLERIGHRKGYLSASIQPEYKGASVTIRFSF